MSKILFFGTPDYVVCVPEALKKAGHEIVAVVTQPPKPVGRKQIITASPVAQWAEKQGIGVLDGETVSELKQLKSEVGVLASYGKIVAKEVIDLFPKGIINIHPSLLPKWRGAAPVQEQLLAGEKELGISLMVMDEQLDHGPIIEQQAMEVSISDTQETLLKKAFQKGAAMLVEVLPDYLEGKLTPKLQDQAKATYTYKTAESKDKAYFDIDNPPSAEQLDRMIRAFYPWPLVWTKWEGKVVKFFPEGKIQIEGKNPVSFKDFKNAYPEFPINL